MAGFFGLGFGGDQLNDPKYYQPIGGRTAPRTATIVSSPRYNLTMILIGVYALV